MVPFWVQMMRSEFYNHANCISFGNLPLISLKSILMSLYMYIVINMQLNRYILNKAFIITLTLNEKIPEFSKVL